MSYISHCSIHNFSTLSSYCWWRYGRLGGRKSISYLSILWIILCYFTYFIVLWCICVKISNFIDSMYFSILFISRPYKLWIIKNLNRASIVQPLASATVSMCIYLIKNQISKDLRASTLSEQVYYLCLCGWKRKGKKKGMCANARA